jgi:hypothetical protein
VTIEHEATSKKKDEPKKIYWMHCGRFHWCRFNSQSSVLLFEAEEDTTCLINTKNYVHILNDFKHRKILKNNFVKK